MRRCFSREIPGGYALPWLPRDLRGEPEIASDTRSASIEPGLRGSS